MGKSVSLVLISNPFILLRCFIVVSSAHLHPQALFFDVLTWLCLHCFELTEPLLCWLGMSDELFSMRYYAKWIYTQNLIKIFYVHHQELHQNLLLQPLILSLGVIVFYSLRTITPVNMIHCKLQAGSNALILDMI